MKKEFEEDQALRDAIAQRLIGRMSFLGLTGQIGLLAASNIFHGLKNKFGPPINNTTNIQQQQQVKENDASTR